MIITIDMNKDQKLHVQGWWADSPEFVMRTLKQQLDAAKAIWPELRRIEWVEKTVADKLVDVLEEAKNFKNDKSE